MYLVVSGSNDPFFNLALEEFLLKNTVGEYAIISINSKSVVSGKHQCIHREANTRFITEHNIPCIRRITGGGTVFHDEGNLNYSFILNCESGKQVDFPRYTLPVLEFLFKIGIKAEMHGSDIKVNGKKISGNAEHIHRNRVLHHGTLLFGADLELLRNSIRRDTSGYETRAVASNPSPVVNIRDLATGIYDISSFSSLLQQHLLSDHSTSGLYEFKVEELEIISKVAESRYKTWDWNFGYGPDYYLNSSVNMGDHRVSFRMYVQEGIIRDMVPEDEGYSGVFSRLTGLRHMPGSIKEFLASEGLSDVDEYSFF